MPTGSLNRSFALGGYAFSNQADAVVTFDHTNVYEVSLPAGKTVTNWVKTDADTAACDLPSGHGYSNGKFDVYWSSGGTNYRRYNVDGTISTNALSLDGGTGSDFPASATSGVVCVKCVEISTAIDGDDVAIFGVFFRNASDTSARGHISFKDSGNAIIAQYDLVEVDNNATGCDVSYSGTGAAAQLTGNPITYCHASNSSTTAAATLYVLVGEDTTP